MSKTVVIYTDGACSGNPGPGGWGAVLQYGSKQKVISGFAEATTNNQMELMAAIAALEQLKVKSNVKLYTDSKYVKVGITEWIHSWKKSNWQNKAKAKVKNADLWKRLDILANKHKVEWVWVKGHSGCPGNEHADTLARAAITNKKGII